MTHAYLVRMGEFGAVGRFRSADAAAYQRGQRVVCRTSRGLEIGEVLGPSTHSENDQARHDGDLLRRMSVEDELLNERLQRHQDEAFQACVDLLKSRRISASLMDVELLFDGSACYFYFLGDPPAEIAAVTDELAKTYHATAQIERFRDTLLQGCGPDCGTEAGGGCSQGGCSACSISSACKAK